MMNLASVKAAYKNPDMIKAVMQVKRENKEIIKPRQLTIDLISKALAFEYRELSKEDLLDLTGLSKAALRNSLLFLVKERKIIKRVIGKYGSGFNYNYSLVRGDL